MTEQKHSTLHGEFTKKRVSPVTQEPLFDFNAEVISQQIEEGKISYADLDSFLLEAYDAQHGIVSTIIEKDGQKQWLRDATESRPLEERISPDAPIMNANNALLRCLSRLRPIDSAINKKLGEGATGICTDMRNKFADLSKKILEIAQDENKDDKNKKAEIDAAEREFNTHLVQQLHNANLTKGCNTAKDAEALLNFYRNLSSQLSPTLPVVTLTYDEKAKVYHRETNTPITQKTESQKNDLKRLEKPNHHPIGEEKNAYTSLMPAQQEAHALFADLIPQDDRMSPAQTRKTQVAGVKNGYVVKVEMAHDRDFEKPIGENIFLVRMGSPVYLGKGASREEIEKQTQEIFKQIRIAVAQQMGVEKAAELDVHITTLNTYSPHQKQSRMIDFIVSARTGMEGIYGSVVPANAEGTAHKMKVDESLAFEGGKRPRGIAPLLKAMRLNSIVNVILAAARRKNTASVVHCASGQDRTGTAILKAILSALEKQLKKLNTNTDTSNLEAAYAKGGLAAFISSYLVHGSPGMKKESIAKNLFGLGSAFSKLVTNALYLKSANTNKKSKVGDVSFLQKPSNQADTDFTGSLAKLEVILESPHDSSQKPLFEIAGNLKKEIKQIKESSSSLTANQLHQLTDLLTITGDTLTSLGNSELQQTENNGKRLSKIAHSLAPKTSLWKKLQGSTVAFARTAYGRIKTLAGTAAKKAELIDNAPKSADLRGKVTQFRKQLEELRNSAVQTETAETAEKRAENAGSGLGN